MDTPSSARIGAIREGANSRSLAAVAMAINAAFSSPLKLLAGLPRGP